EIKEVHSHSHAIAQCHQYLHQHMPNASLHFSSSTARAAEIVSEKRMGTIASIGNTLAAKEYGLQIVQKNIHDYPNNHTRFAVLANDKNDVAIKKEKSGDKTTLLITLPSDHAG